MHIAVSPAYINLLETQGAKVERNAVAAAR